MEGKWRKSSYSNGGEANCVEVLATWVRDSKAPDRGVLRFADEAWQPWLSAVKAGRFDR